MRELGIKFKKDQRLIRLSGYIDEFADYSPLLQCEAPLKLNMRDVVAVNSVGIHKWMNFIREWGGKQLEFHECSVVFVETANVVPTVVSAKDNMRRIKSVVVPYVCERCGDSLEFVVTTEEVLQIGEDCSVPAKMCPKCGTPARSEVDPTDHFLFITIKGGL